MTGAQFFAYLTAVIATYHLPGLLGVSMALLGIVIVLPSITPQRWKL